MQSAKPKQKKKKLSRKTKIVKSSAQRQKEYRERKKIAKLLQCPKRIPKTNAQHQQKFRQNQKKILQQNESLNLARKKMNAERSKRYRDKLKSKKQHSELHSSLSSKEDLLQTILIKNKESDNQDRNCEELILSQFQMQTNQIQQPMNNEAEQVISPNFQSFQARYEKYGECSMPNVLLHNETNITGHDTNTIKTEVASEGDIEELSSDNLYEFSSHELETSGYSQEKSLYTDDKVQKTSGNDTADAESDSEGYVCNECNKPIKCGRFTCAQCVDYDLCAQCAGERAAHRQHYLLRVPPRRPPDEVERVLQTIRSMLDIAAVASPAKDRQIEEIKTEIKEEIDIYEEPLRYGIKQEIREEEDNYATLKHIVPVSVDIEYTAKRRKQEACDVTSGGVLQSSLVGESSAAECTVPSIVKQENEPSLRTFAVMPSIPSSRIPSPRIPTMLTVSTASRQAQAPTLVTGGACVSGVKWPLAPVSAHGRTPVQIPSLVIENMQIRVASDQSDNSEDASPSQGPAARWRGLGPL